MSPRRSKRGLDPDHISGGTAPCRADAVASVEVDGQAVVYDERNERLVVLNPTASILWALFDGSVTIDELADDFGDVYQTDPATVRADLLEATREMGRQGLLLGVAAEGSLGESAQHSARDEPPP